MIPVEVKSNTYSDFSNEINYQDFIFKIVDIVRILKYKNIFAKWSNPKCSDVFAITKVKK